MGSFTTFQSLGVAFVFAFTAFLICSAAVSDAGSDVVGSKDYALAEEELRVFDTRELQPESHDELFGFNGPNKPNEFAHHFATASEFQNGSLGSADAAPLQGEEARRTLADAPPPLDVAVAVSSVVLNTVQDRYVCVNIDWNPSASCSNQGWGENFACTCTATNSTWPSCRWWGTSVTELPLNHPNIINAFKALSPGLVRVAGTNQEKVVYFDDRCTGPWCLTKARWDEWNAFLAATNTAQLFSVRCSYGMDSARTLPWDPSNARALLEYTLAKGYPIFSWSFGNEPVFAPARVTPDRYGKDLRAFRTLFDDVYSATPPAARPLVMAGSFFSSSNLNQFWVFLNSSGDAGIDALGMHSYRSWGRGNFPDAGLERPFDENWLNGFRGQIDFTNVLKGLAPKAEAWMTETGGILYGDWRAWHPTARSITFANSIWFLDEMASAAKKFTLYCRQALVGGNWGMLDNLRDYRPYPDFYAAMAFKKLAGRRVLTALSGNTKVRSHAFCARGRPGHVMLLLLNINPVSVAVSPTFDGVAVSRHETYSFTAPNDPLTDKTVLLNGVPFTRYSLPGPLVVNTAAVVVPARSYMMDVVDVGWASTCP